MYEQKRRFGDSIRGELRGEKVAMCLILVEVQINTGRQRDADRTVDYGENAPMYIAQRMSQLLPDGL